MVRTMTTTEVGIDELTHDMSSRFLFPAPVPNPFTANVMLSFSMPRSGRISIKAYDITGRVVATVIDQTLDPGAHQIIWNGTDDQQRKVSSGIYFLRVIYENESITRKVIVLGN